MIDKSQEFQITFDYLDRETQRRVEQSKNNEISDPKLLRLTIEGQKKKQG